MMPWAVSWEDSAEDDLARVWLTAADPNAVTAAQARADRLLAQNPLANGQQVSEGLYKITVPPLVLYYSVDSAKHSVRVSDLRTLP